LARAKICLRPDAPDAPVGQAGRHHPFPPEVDVIAVQNLTRRFGAVVALDDLSFEVRPGVVTGFLGPNGAGKSTVMRTAVGLSTPNSGRVLLEGRSYRDLPDPLREVGAVLDGNAFHPARSARSHLRYLAVANRLPPRRVEEVLSLTGLTDAAGRRVGRFSLGMKQRLAIAAGMLGDPATLILDEPNNGLDPEGIVWLRHLLTGLAAEGRTVLVSSHVINELAHSVERLVLIGRGRLIADAPLADLAPQGGPSLEEVYLDLTSGAAAYTSGSRGRGLQ
jgi:ABC-2 type transport system ATP-binding protein